MSFSRWMDTKIVVYVHNGVLLSYQKQWLYEVFKKIDASREYHPEWDNPVTKEQTYYAVIDNGILTPERSHRVYEVQEKTEPKRKKKKRKWKPIMLNLYTPRTLWPFPCYILFYMYFMLIVTSKILMHTIKALKNQVLTKMYLYTFIQKCLHLCIYLCFLK